MSNPRRSSIRIGSTSVYSKDASEPGSTDPPPAQHLSSSSQTPQLGTELFSTESSQPIFEDQNQMINAGVELMEDSPSSIPANELIADLSPFETHQVTHDYDERIGRRIGPYLPIEE
ncbi:hypothetical protein P9112_010466 [Eukaryota sp. TZLM1-RC]